MKAQDLNALKTPRGSCSREGVNVHFLGRQAPGERRAALDSLTNKALDLAFVQQIHSNSVVKASTGCCGKADGLWTVRQDLALSIATADCVPVVLGDQNRLAAIHAGWRGIVGGIVDRAVETLEDPTGLAAWIGPAIGPCCYEVGPDVARQIAAASSERVVTPGPSGRPHVDICGAVTTQLEALGIREIHQAVSCTRCASAEFWSYRACGGGAGRNFTFAWLAGPAGESGSGRSPGS